MSKIEVDIDYHNCTFFKYVWPEFEKWYASLYDLEEVLQTEVMFDDDLAKRMDLSCGVDLWLRNKNGIHLVAKRVEYVNKLWESFTVRWKKIKNDVIRDNLELRKMCNAIECGFLMPSLTVQAYLEKGSNELLGFAVARTKDIIMRIIDREKLWAERKGILDHTRQYENSYPTKEEGRVYFKTVWWDEIECLHIYKRTL